MYKRQVSTILEKPVFKVGKESCSREDARAILMNYQKEYSNLYGIDMWEHDYGQEQSLEDYIKDLTLAQMAQAVSYTHLAIPPGADCVILGDIERTRLEGIKVLFFLGVNDGMIPKSTANGGILSQYDRELIEEQKLQLSPTAREQSFLQRFYLYLNMTKPSEALCLTYARMDAKQKAARPSYLIGTLQKLFAGLQVQEIEAGTAFEPLTAKSSLDAYLTGLTAARDGEVTEEWKALHQYLKNSKVWEPVVQELFAAAFSKFTGEQLAIETARQLYGTILTNSVTRLELFARCAYAHFLEYGLKLSERETYSFRCV